MLIVFPKVSDISQVYDGAIYEGRGVLKGENGTVIDTNILNDKELVEREQFLKDWPFIEGVWKMLRNRPKEWGKFSDSEIGRRTILWEEVEKADSASSLIEKKESLIRIGAALLNLYRKLHEEEK